MIPRGYQTEAVDAAVLEIEDKGAAILVLPTGAGKTVVAGMFILRRLLKVGSALRVLVLQHTDELVTQNHDSIAEITGLTTSVVAAERNDWTGQIVFGSVPTLARSARMAEMAIFDSLVVDECHHSSADSWLRVIMAAKAANPRLRLLSLSATPVRGDSQPLPKILGEIAYKVYIKQLVDQGYLVPPRAFSVNLGVDEAIAAIDTAKANADQKIAQILNTPKFNATVVSQWKARAAGRPTVAFCSTIEHAENVAEAFNQAGVPAAAVGANTEKKERKRIIAAYKAGEILVLCNCLMLTEGFDFQPTSCVLILRAMISASTFIQALGRALRIVNAAKYPGIVKWDAVCLDFANAAVRHATLDGGSDLPIMRVDPYDLESGHDQGVVGDRAESESNETDDFAPVLEEVDLEASDFRWTDIHGDGSTLLVSGLSGFAAVLRAGSHWASVGRSKAGKLQVLQMGARQHAYAAACDFIRRTETDDKAVGNRRWLDHDATPGQIGTLRKMGYDPPAGLSKYSASCRITYMIEKRNVVDVVRQQLDQERRHALPGTQQQLPFSS